MITAGTHVVNLRTDAILDVHGEEAHEFLHGQLTSDVNALQDDELGWSAYCTIKGRVLAMFRIARIAKDHYRLRLPQELVEFLVKRLSLYRMRSQVSFDHRSDWIGVAWVDANSEFFAELKQNAHRVQQQAFELRLSDVGDRTRLEIWGSPEDVEARLEAAGVDLSTADATPAGEESWRGLEIEAREPRLAAATAEKFLPQMLDLERLGALSYTKGCFPGQEVVARLHHLGEAKRLLTRSKVAPGELPQPYAELVDLEDQDSRTIGNVLSAARAEQGIDILAVVKNEHRDRSLGLGPRGD